MAYSALADVQNEFKSLVFSATSTPTDATVTGFITQADAEIDARIGLRYSVPVNTTSSPIAAVTLKRISAWLVASRVMEITKVKSGDPNTSQAGRGNDIGTLARNQLDQIAKGLYLLADAPLVNNTQGTGSFAYNNGEEFTFDKDSDQW